MEEKFNNAIKAGVIGGITFVIIALIDMVGVLSIRAPLSCAILALLFATALVTGALAVRFAKPHLNTHDDVIAVSALAGFISGVVYAVIQLITSIIESAAMYSTVNNNFIYSLSWWTHNLSGVCWVDPFEVAVAIILAVLGGTIYRTLVARLP